MQTDTTPYFIYSVPDLGSLARKQRKRLGYTSLDSGARALSVGKRFLSEFERGKETAEIGKVLSVIQGLGLTLAVVEKEDVVEEPGEREALLQSKAPLKRNLTRKLNLDFPYDWSNPEMSDETLIHKVVEKGRFMDILRLAGHYGIGPVEAAAQQFMHTPNWPRLRQILDRIRTGKAREAALDPTQV